MSASEDRMVLAHLRGQVAALSAVVAALIDALPIEQQEASYGALMDVQLDVAYLTMFDANEVVADDEKQERLRGFGEMGWQFRRDPALSAALETGFVADAGAVT